MSGLFADLFDRAFEHFFSDERKKVNRLSYLSKNLGEASEDRLFMQFIPIELQPFDELLDRTFGFEWQQRKTKRDVTPLARIF